MAQKIIPFTATEIRQKWLKKLGGLPLVSVKNREWRALLIDDGRNTLAIEGEFDSKLNLEEVLSKPDYELMSVKKVMNFFEAAINFYELAYRQRQENEFTIRKSDILSIHAILFRNVPRSFTQQPGTWSLIKREVGKARFDPLPPYKILEWVEKILWYVHQLKTPPTRKAAIFHAFFEHIHPFPDGNGRVGRILLNFVLLAHGLPSIAIKGEKKKDRDLYYAALEETDPIIARVLSGKLTLAKLPTNFCPKLENLLEKYLADSLDHFICGKFFTTHEPVAIADLAKKLGRSSNALAVAASQKKIISVIQKGVRVSHPYLLNAPQ